MAGQRGFSYVVVMFLVAVLSLVSLRALRNTLTAERRAKEAELLATGMAYRSAIRDYYENSQGTAKVYPTNLKALLRDDRGTIVHARLRKPFRDPVTGSADWGVILLEGTTDQVIGVYSLSGQKPLKRGGFPPEMGDLSKASSYRDWKFIYKPN